MPEQDIRNPHLTYYIKDNQFRLIIQGENTNNMSKPIALQVRTLIDRILPRHAYDTVHGATKLTNFQNLVSNSMGTLLKCIAKGLIPVKAGKVNLISHGEQRGWALVNSEYKLQCGNDYALIAASANLLNI